MTFSKSILSLLVATFAFAGLAQAKVNTELTADDLKGHVFESMNPRHNNRLVIEADGSWVLTGKLVDNLGGEIRGKSISVEIKNFGSDDYQLLNLETGKKNDQFGGMVDALDARMKSALKQQTGKDASLILTFSNAEGGEVLLAK